MTYQDTVRNFRLANTREVFFGTAYSGIDDFLSMMENLSAGETRRLYDTIHETRVETLEEKILYCILIARRENFLFYAAQGEVQERGKGDILLISHELSRTGAPVVLQDMAVTLRKQGYRITLAAAQDGPLRPEFTQAGFPVVIDNTICDLGSKDLGFCQLLIDHALLAVANTVETYKVVMSNIGTENKILWWLHEALEAFQVKKDILPKHLTENIRVLFVADFVRSNMKQAGLSYEGSILHYGVHAVKQQKIPHETVNFICVGAYCRRKGQDLLADAVSRLPLDVMQHSRFYFVGPGSEYSLAASIRKMSAAFPNVFYFEDMPREQLQKLYEEMDCLIVSSRDDPLPVVAAENMSLGHTCIVSSNTGTADLITDGENGFVFQNEDVQDLMAKIIYVVQHQEQLEWIGQRSENLFHQYFDMSVFERKVTTLVEAVVEETYEQ